MLRACSIAGLRMEGRRDGLGHHFSLTMLGSKARIPLVLHGRLGHALTKWHLLMFWMHFTHRLSLLPSHLGLDQRWTSRLSLRKVAPGWTTDVVLRSTKAMVCRRGCSRARHGWLDCCRRHLGWCSLSQGGKAGERRWMGRSRLRRRFWLLCRRSRIFDILDRCWCQRTRNLGLRSIVTALCRRSRRRWRTQVFSSFSPFVGSLCNLDQLKILTSVRLASVFVFDLHTLEIIINVGNHLTIAGVLVPICLAMAPKSVPKYPR